MARVAYRLWSNKEIEEVNRSFIYDVDEDFTSKSEYIKTAKELTKRFNEEMNTNYTWQEVFGEPKDEGYRYCSRCDCYFYDDENCDCDW